MKKQFLRSKNSDITFGIFLIIVGLASANCYANDEESEDDDGTSQLRSSLHLPLNLAMKSAMAALRKCRRDGYAVSVTVVDRSGVVIAQVRNPMAGPHTIGSSMGKAFTSASMGQPTTQLAEMIAANHTLEGLRDMDSRMVILAGGLPIVLGGQRVGGIGVGGAPGGHLDEACAKFGLEKIGAL